MQIAGKDSELCLIGPEKVDSASIRGPTANATDPVLPEVSIVRVKGFCVIIFYKLRFFLLFIDFPRKPHCANKKAVFLFTIFPSLPNYTYQFGELMLTYYRLNAYKSIFHLQKHVFLYKLVLIV